MSVSEDNLSISPSLSDTEKKERCNPVSYEAAVMCDKYNAALYKLFNVYACDYNGELLHSIDDQLDLLTDYGILPKFISKEDAVNSYIRIADRRNDCSKIATANLLDYEGFIESLCRVALIVFANPSLQGLYESTGMKIAMFLELWNLGDEKNLTIHREERKNLKQSKKNIVY